MILNFLRVAECPLAYMVSSSYSEYHSQKANARDIIAASKLRSTIETLRQSVKSIDSTVLQSSYDRCQQFWNAVSRIQQVIVDQDRTSHRFLDELLQCGRIIRIRDVYDIDVPAMVIDGSFSSSGKGVDHQRIISVLVISRSKNRPLTDIDRLILKENEAMFVVPVRKWKLDDTSYSQGDLLYQIKNIHLTDILDITNEVIPNVNYRDILEGHWNHRMTDEIDIQHESTMANDKALKKSIEKLKTVRETHSDQSSKCSPPTKHSNRHDPFYLCV